MKSMTGFGKHILETDDYQVDVEIKSVNHRFLDVQIRSPRQVNPFELALRQTVKKHLQRGRIEVFINIREKGTGTKNVVIQWPLIDQLAEGLKAGLAQRGSVLSDELLNELLPAICAQPDYIAVEEGQSDASALESLVLEAMEQACIALDASRSREGAGIAEVLDANQRDFSEAADALLAFNAGFEADFQQRFETKLKTWLGDKVNEDRLITEMALLLERGDIHEELDRLNIHLEKLRQLLQRQEPVGRELDFLIQEMNREVNTIGSKSSPIEIKNLVVQMKTILEKIREQIQNVE